MTISIQREPIDPTLEYDRLVGESPGPAVATFTGYVRDHADDRQVCMLELEHYPEMASRVLKDLGCKATLQFDLSNWRIVHRFGELKVEESIVWVGAMADHRGEAISACEFMLDTLKTDAPFWKREIGPAGKSWVSSRTVDLRRRARWLSQENL